MKLFDDNWGIDNSEIDDTQITTTILYFSEKELTEFKKLCKAGMKIELGDQATSKGNLSDFLLIMLRQYHANNNS